MWFSIILIKVKLALTVIHKISAFFQCIEGFTNCILPNICYILNVFWGLWIR